MALTWTTDIYNQAYTTYNHSWASASGFAIYAEAIQRMTSHAAFTPASSVLFVGCGFGYWMEYLLTIPGVQAGNVWGIDNGPHITNNKTNPIYANTSITSKILDLDVLSPNILNSLRPFFGGNGRVNGWIISTLVLTSLQNDTEITNFRNALEGIKAPQGRIAHVFASSFPGGRHDSSFGMNWQPRTYWSSRLSTHWLIDIHGWAYGDNGIWNPNTGAWS